MATLDEKRRIAEAGTDSRDGLGTRIVLQPIAAPSVLGLFGFAAATFIVAAHMAGWYGTADTPTYLFPFAAFFGGLAQFMAGMWAYRARDAVATAMHGAWGSFWLGYGLLWLLLATGRIPSGTTMDVALGFWFIALGAITASGTLGALVEGSLGVAAVLATLAGGSGLAAIGLLHQSTGVEHAAGWVLVISACLAWYVATAMMVGAAAGRTVLPLFKTTAAANVPGRRPVQAIELEWAEPGIRQGQ